MRILNPAIAGRSWALLRVFLTGMLLGFCVLLQPASDAQAEYRVVMVLPRPEGAIEKAFTDYFAKRGIGLQTTTLRYSGKAEDQPALIARIRELAPDLIYTWGTPTTVAVAGRYDAPQAERGRSIRDVPIVFTSVTDPVAAGLVPDLEHPGRNLTGASHLAPLPVQINTISAYRPFKRLGLVYNPKEANAVLIRKELEKLGSEQGFSLIAEAVPLNAAGQPDASQLPDMIRKVKEAGAEFLYIGPDTFIGFSQRDVVTNAALELRLPTFAAIESPIRKSKALFGLFSPQPNVGRFAAYKALRILEHGSSVGDVPIETLQHFSLLINMAVARDLELFPPLMLLNVADVIPDERLQPGGGAQTSQAAEGAATSNP